LIQGSPKRNTAMAQAGAREHRILCHMIGLEMIGLESDL
jgi:hypothetical protein